MVFYGYCAFASDYDAIAVDDIKLISSEPTTITSEMTSLYTISSMSINGSIELEICYIGFKISYFLFVEPSVETTTLTTSNTTEKFTCSPETVNGNHPAVPGTCGKFFYFCRWQGGLTSGGIYVPVLRVYKQAEYFSFIWIINEFNSFFYSLVRMTQSLTLS